MHGGKIQDGLRIPRVPEVLRDDDEPWQCKKSVAPRADRGRSPRRSHGGRAGHPVSETGRRPAEDGAEARAVSEDAEEGPEVLDLPALRRAGLLQAGGRQDRPERVVLALRSEAEVACGDSVRSLPQTARSLTSATR